MIDRARTLLGRRDSESRHNGHATTAPANGNGASANGNGASANGGAPGNGRAARNGNGSAPGNGRVPSNGKATAQAAASNGNGHAPAATAEPPPAEECSTRVRRLPGFRRSRSEDCEPGGAYGGAVEMRISRSLLVSASLGLVFAALWVSQNVSGDRLALPWVSADVLAVATAVVLLAVLALFLQREDDPLEAATGPALPKGLRYHALFERRARQVAPAAVAAVAVVGQTGEVHDGVLVGSTMIAVGTLLFSPRYPLHLAHVARLTLQMLVPFAGIAIALALSLLLNSGLTPAILLTPLLWACLVSIVAGWLEDVFKSERPIRLAVIGHPGLGSAFSREMETTGFRKYEVVGWISEEQLHEVPPVDEENWLGSMTDLRSVVLDHGIDLFIVAANEGRLQLFERLASSSLDLPVRTIEASSLYEEVHGRVPIGAINSTWYQYMMHPRYRPHAGGSKRLLDLVVAGLFTIAVLPLIGILAVLVKLEDGGPAFYRQRRVGERGREFSLVKLRSMREDAERNGGAQWATAEDDRITRVGAILRKTHLDELPQLFNVLAGDMSLVGPRPERPELVEELERRIPHYQRRLMVKPGVTGWAQIHCGYSGSNAGTAWKLCHDLYYIKHRSLLFDLLIVVETIRTLVWDLQFAEFTLSEAFILGEEVIRDDEARHGSSAVLKDTAAMAESAPQPAARVN